MGKYATFKGRASRSEYWWFYLFFVLLSWGATIVGTVVSSDFGPTLSGIVSLALFIPSVSAATRRLHDTGKSGWWQLLYFTIIGIPFLIYFLASRSDPNDNAYGSFDQIYNNEILENSTSTSNLEKLQKLHELKEKGVITEVEYQKQKSLIM